MLRSLSIPGMMKYQRAQPGEKPFAAKGLIARNMLRFPWLSFHTDSIPFEHGMKNSPVSLEQGRGRCPQPFWKIAFRCTGSPDSAIWCCTIYTGDLFKNNLPVGRQERWEDRGKGSLQMFFPFLMLGIHVALESISQMTYSCKLYINHHHLYINPVQ